MGKFSSLPLLLDLLSAGTPKVLATLTEIASLLLVHTPRSLRGSIRLRGRATTLVMAVRECREIPTCPACVHASCGSGCRVARWCASPGNTINSTPAGAEFVSEASATGSRSDEKGT